MTDRAWMAVTMGVVLLVILGNSSGLIPFTPRPEPAVVAPPADVPDFSAIFSSNPDHREAKAHLEMSAELFASLARGIEFDESLGQMRLNRSGDVEDVRMLSVHYFMRGWSFSQMYPSFGEKVGAFLDARCGKDGEGNLTTEARAKWKQAYRDLELGSIAAHRKL